MTQGSSTEKIPEVNAAKCVYVHRGGRVNGGHLREQQDKTKSIRKVENIYKPTFNIKGLLLKYAV
jgi:hypothetical protein